MKKMMQVLMLSALMGMLLVSTAIAQRGGWGPQTKYAQLFDPATMVSLKGTVVSINQFVPETGGSFGLHLMVKTPNEGTIAVHLGPTWYLDNQEIKFVVGEMVYFTGSKVRFNNAPAIIAVQVEKGDYLLKLRDRNGHPVWQGWKERGKGRNVF